MHSQDSFGFDPNHGAIPRLVALMIDEALELGATEILLERSHDRVDVHYRIDGVLQQRDCPPPRFWHLILARLHTLAAQGIREAVYDHVIISGRPSEIGHPEGSRDKHPVTLRLEIEHDAVRLTFEQIH